MSKQPANLMPQVAFSVLLALSLRPRHGYEIMQQVEDDSAGRVKLGPGALYGSIKKLIEDKLIEEVPSRAPKDRRRYYKLTPEGWNRLNAELEYFQNAVEVARTRQSLTFGFGA